MLKAAHDIFLAQMPSFTFPPQSEQVFPIFVSWVIKIIFTLIFWDYHRYELSVMWHPNTLKLRCGHKNDNLLMMFRHFPKKLNILTSPKSNRCQTGQSLADKSEIFLLKSITLALLFTCIDFNICHMKDSRTDGNWWHTLSHALSRVTRQPFPAHTHTNTHTDHSWS